jgi:hypothetical protein
MKVYVTRVRQQLVELLLVGPVRPLDLAIELRGAWLDVGMTDALVLDVPMELGLELMAIVGSHLADPEGEPGNDVVDEGDRIGLGATGSGSRAGSWLWSIGNRLCMGCSSSFAAIPPPGVFTAPTTA